MSAETLQNLETAIKAHVKSRAEQEEDDSNPVVIDWLVGYTLSAIVQLDDGESVVGYVNDFASADNNPNGQVALAGWVGESIMDRLRTYE